MKTGSIEDHDNIFCIKLYGVALPKEGRLATLEEERNIRKWIRSVKLVDEIEDGSYGEGKIVVEVIQGKQPVEIKAIGRDRIEMIDNVGFRRVLEHVEMKGLLDKLSGFQSS